MDQVTHSVPFQLKDQITVTVKIYAHLRASLQVPAGGHSYSCTLDQRLIFLCLGKVVLLTKHAASRGKYRAVRDEGNTHLASQISQISPGDQWVTCHPHIHVFENKRKIHWLASPIVSSVLPLRRGHLLSVHVDFCGGSVDKDSPRLMAWVWSPEPT